VVQYVSGMATPSSSFIFEVAQKFFFLAIYADYGTFVTLKAPTSSREKSELLISVRIVCFRQSLAIGSQRILHLTQQSTNRYMSDRNSSLRQSIREIACCFVGPAQTAHRVSRCRISEQLLQQSFDLRAFFRSAFVHHQHDELDRVHPVVMHHIRAPRGQSSYGRAP
jgi:hypothetical protein